VGFSFGAKHLGGFAVIQSMIEALSKGTVGCIGSLSVVFLADGLAPVRAVGVVFTVLIAVATFISVSLDIRRKWRNRDKP
jgi:hypothetical protein